MSSFIYLKDIINLSLGINCILIFLCGEQVVTWIVVLLTLVIAYCLLEDWTVIDLNDLDDNCIQQQRIPETNETVEGEVEEYYDDRNADRIDVITAKPMVKPHLLRRWFPNQYQLMHHENNEFQHQKGNDEGAEARRLPTYKMYRTQYTRSDGGNTTPCAGILEIINQVVALLRIRSTWRGISYRALVL